MNILKYTPDRPPSSEETAAIANLFRETFNNPPYAGKGQLLFDLDADAYLGAADCGLPTDEFGNAGLADMDAFIAQKVRDSRIVVHDPQRVEELLRRKFQKAHLATLVNEDALQGFAFAYETTGAGAFENEEWGHPFNYSDAVARMHIPGRDLQSFLQVTGLEADQAVVVSNCVLIRSAHQGGGMARELLRVVHESIPPNAAQWMLGETTRDTVMHGLLQRRGFEDLPDFLPDPVVLVRNDLRDALAAFCG